jgi:hypothetical protein
MEYKVRKRKAYLIQEFQVESIIKSHFKCKTWDPKYHYVKTPKNIYCVYCGEPANFKVYFQTQGVILMEKYCSACLDKFVIIPDPESVPIIGK